MTTNTATSRSVSTIDLKQLMADADSIIKKMPDIKLKPDDRKNLQNAIAEINKLKDRTIHDAFTLSTYQVLLDKDNPQMRGVSLKRLMALCASYLAEKDQDFLIIGAPGSMPDAESELKTLQENLQGITKLLQETTEERDTLQTRQLELSNEIAELQQIREERDVLLRRQETLDAENSALEKELEALKSSAAPADTNSASALADLRAELELVREEHSLLQAKYRSLEATKSKAVSSGSIVLPQPSQEGLDDQRKDTVHLVSTLLGLIREHDPLDPKSDKSVMKHLVVDRLEAEIGSLV